MTAECQCGYADCPSHMSGACRNPFDVLYPMRSVSPPHIYWICGTCREEQIWRDICAENSTRLQDLVARFRGKP